MNPLHAQAVKCRRTLCNAPRVATVMGHRLCVHSSTVCAKGSRSIQVCIPRGCVLNFLIESPTLGLPSSIFLYLWFLGPQSDGAHTQSERDTSATLDSRGSSIFSWQKRPAAASTPITAPNPILALQAQPVSGARIDEARPFKA